MPDSRAEAKGLGSAKRGERPGRGRRHLVVKSQVKRQSRRERESACGLEQTASNVAFLPHPRECAGKRIFGRKSKTLEIISLKCRHAVRTRDLRPAQSAALEPCVQANLRVTPPLLEADALARAAALKPRGVRKGATLRDRRSAG